MVQGAGERAAEANVRCHHSKQEEGLYFSDAEAAGLSLRCSAKSIKQVQEYKTDTMVLTHGNVALIFVFP